MSEAQNPRKRRLRRKVDDSSSEEDMDLNFNPMDDFYQTKTTAVTPEAADSDDTANKESETVSKETDAADKESETVSKETDAADKESETASKESDVENTASELETADKDSDAVNMDSDAANKNTVDADDGDAHSAPTTKIIADTASTQIENVSLNHSDGGKKAAADIGGENTNPNTNTYPDPVADVDDDDNDSDEDIIRARVHRKIRRPMVLDSDSESDWLHE